jgi:hypothetical protein
MWSSSFLSPSEAEYICNIISIDHPHVPSTFSYFLPRRTLIKLVIPAAERLSLGSASQDGSQPSSTRCSAAVVFCLFELLFCILLPMFTSVVLVFWSLWLNTPMKSLLMVTLPLWHPCLKSNDPYLRNHCLRVLSFIVLILGCSDPSIFMFFLFLL